MTKESANHSHEDMDKLEASLVDRYNFQAEKRERIDDRPVVVLSFRPKKAALPEKGMADRVFNRLAGRVWIDETEAEVVQVEVGLTDELSLGWLGMVGSLKQCDITIAKQRLPENIWVNKSFAVSLRGRKVLSSMRLRTTETFYNFRKPLNTP
jgi:hypothetical protein